MWLLCVGGWIVWSAGYESDTASFSSITARNTHLTRDSMRKSTERIVISTTADILDRPWSRATESVSPEGLCGRTGVRRRPLTGAETAARFGRAAGFGAVG